MPRELDERAHADEQDVVVGLEGLRRLVFGRIASADAADGKALDLPRDADVEVGQIFIDGELRLRGARRALREAQAEGAVRGVLEQGAELAGEVGLVVDRVGDQQAGRRVLAGCQLVRERLAVPLVDDMRVARERSDLRRREGIRVPDGRAVHRHADGVGIDELTQVPGERGLFMLLKQDAFIEKTRHKQPPIIKKLRRT